MRVGVPIVFVLLAFLLWWLRPRGINFTDRAAMDASLQSQRTALGPMTAGQRNTAIVFATAVALWMWPGLVQLLTGQKILGTAWMEKFLKEETVGLLAGLSLFLLPTNRASHRFTLTWEDAVRIDWGTIFLFAGGLALGTQIFATGLAAAMGQSMSAWLGSPSLWTLIAAGIVLSLILSEATSNTASANVMVPLFLVLANSASLPQKPVALAVSLACSFGFMLPVSTGPNAMAYGTGMVPLTTMVRAGFALDIAGAITIWLAVRLLA
jgi:sodium-dependent dicarboxylate transporter 2/3/5